MHCSINVRGVGYTVPLVTTSKEKNYLLFYKDEGSIDSIFDLLVDMYPEPPHELNTWEKKFVLLLQRVNSQGPHIEYETVCTKCDSVNSHVVNLEEDATFHTDETIVTDGKFNISIQFGEPIKATYENQEVDIKVALDNINIKKRSEIEKLKKGTFLEITSQKTCFSCGEKMVYDLNTDADFRDIVSNADIQNLYQISHDLQYSGHLSLTDFGNLVSFERELYVSMLNKTIEDKNKQQQG